MSAPVRAPAHGHSPPCGAAWHPVERGCLRASGGCLCPWGSGRRPRVGWEGLCVSWAQPLRGALRRARPALCVAPVGAVGTEVEAPGGRGSGPWDVGLVRPRDAGSATPHVSVQDTSHRVDSRCTRVCPGAAVTGRHRHGAGLRATEMYAPRSCRPKSGCRRTTPPLKAPGRVLPAASSARWLQASLCMWLHPPGPCPVTTRP